MQRSFRALLSLVLVVSMLAAFLPAVSAAGEPVFSIGTAEFTTDGYVWVPVSVVVTPGKFTGAALGVDFPTDKLEGVIASNKATFDCPTGAIVTAADISMEEDVATNGTNGHIRINFGVGDPIATTGGVICRLKLKIKDLSTPAAIALVADGDVTDENVTPIIGSTFNGGTVADPDTAAVTAALAAVPATATVTDTQVDYTLPAAPTGMNFNWERTAGDSTGAFSSGKYVPSNRTPAAAGAVDQTATLKVTATKGNATGTKELVLTLKPLSETEADALNKLTAAVTAAEAAIATSAPIADLKVAVDAMNAAKDHYATAYGKQPTTELQAKIDAVNAAWAAKTPKELVISATGATVSGNTNYDISVSANPEYKTVTGSDYTGDYYVVVQVMNDTTPVATFGYSSADLKEAGKAKISVGSSSKIKISVIDSFDGATVKVLANPFTPSV